jgi:hypothetical protein
MSSAPFTDEAATKLRAAVAVIEREITQASSTPALRTAWAELVDVLALGPAPQTRECTRCHRIGMRAATRCGFCWQPLAPLPPLASDTTTTERDQETA